MTDCENSCFDTLERFFPVSLQNQKQHEKLKIVKTWYSYSVYVKVVRIHCSHSGNYQSSTQEHGTIFLLQNAAENTFTQVYVNILLDITGKNFNLEQKYFSHYVFLQWKTFFKCVQNN